MTEEFLDVKNVIGFCVFCGCFPVAWRVEVNPKYFRVPEFVGYSFPLTLAFLARYSYESLPHSIQIGFMHFTFTILVNPFGSIITFTIGSDSTRCKKSRRIEKKGFCGRHLQRIDALLFLGLK